jgi:hypothetical protein
MAASGHHSPIRHPPQRGECYTVRCRADLLPGTGGKVPEPDFPRLVGFACKYTLKAKPAPPATFLPRRGHLRRPPMRAIPSAQLMTGT